MKMEIVCELQGYDAYEVLTFAFAAREEHGGFFFGTIRSVWEERQELVGLATIMSIWTY
jgi:hypothetical protein